MFKQSNYIGKYRIYAKALKAFQNKVDSGCRSSIGNKYEILKKSVNNVVESSKLTAGQSKILNVAHDKITEKVERTKEKCTNFTQAIRSNRFLNPKLLCAAAFVKADSTTISGYSQTDYDILKQLGIIVEDTNAASNASSHVASSHLSPSVDTTNVPETNNPSTSIIETESNSIIDYLPSNYDTQNNYPSIFDNMPDERNDLYTTLANAFNFTKEKSTQISNNDLQLTTEIQNPQQNEFTNDLFMTESPSVQQIPASTNETSNFATDVGDGELLASNEITASVTNAGNDLGSEPLLVTDNNSNIEIPLDNVVIEPIPEPPSAPDLAAEAASQINALGEPTFASLGLGGWTPVGIVENCFEYLHVTLGIPWWEAIAIGTLVIRFALFPLVVIAQRNAAKMNNHLPQMQVIQLKMTEARQSGNQMEVARYSQELMMFMKEKDLNPFKNMIVPLVQMPVFVSFFMGLRQMANVPVESLRTGGMFWFTDLTVPDQFFALPVITSLTLYATIELGTDSARLSSQNLQTMKYVLRALPFVILPFTVNFPGAILCYWVSSNFISLGQVGFLKIPAVRDYFKIDPLLKHDQTKLPIKNKGFVGGLKDSWTNIKITKEIEERRRLDELQFQRAGKGPLVKTYKYDPTKQVKNAKITNAAVKSSN